jgi:hypothetical protein
MEVILLETLEREKEEEEEKKAARKGASMGPSNGASAEPAGAGGASKEPAGSQVESEVLVSKEPVVVASDKKEKEGGAEKVVASGSKAPSGTKVAPIDAVPTFVDSICGLICQKQGPAPALVPEIMSEHDDYAFQVTAKHFYSIFIACRLS